MKYLQVSLVFLIFSISACATSRNNFTDSAKITRDCSGTYLRIDQKDYLVCNNSILQNFKEGQMVRVNFKKIQDCSELPEMVCMLYHENEGMVKILKIIE